VVIGAPNSSNSMRLVEVAANYGCRKSRLVQRAVDMDWDWLEGASRLGITAGASAPETLVDELIAACRERYDVTVEECGRPRRASCSSCRAPSSHDGGGLMAVYTEVSDAELEAFLAEYDIGEPESFKGIAEGVENSNYLLTTTKGPYFVTLYEKRVDPKDLPFFLRPDGPSRRTRHQLPAADPRPRRQGAAHPGGAAGRHHDLPAGAMAAPHDVEPLRTGRRSVGCPAPGRPRLRAQAAQCLVGPGLAAIVRRLEPSHRRVDGAELKGEIDFFEASWPTGLPSGVIHADLFNDNVLFLHDRLSGLIDFYFACNDAFAYDVAICLNAWCFEPDKSFNATKGRALLQATNACGRSMPTSARGCRCWPAARRCASC
jgi:homoserine kinase type II